jgi:hypothetical protein
MVILAIFVTTAMSLTMAIHTLGFPATSTKLFGFFPGVGTGVGTPADIG